MFILGIKSLSLRSIKQYCAYLYTHTYTKYKLYLFYESHMNERGIMTSIRYDASVLSAAEEQMQRKNKKLSSYRTHKLHLCWCDNLKILINVNLLFCEVNNVFWCEIIIRLLFVFVLVHLFS